jgi:hypothetical protein
MKIERRRSMKYIIWVRVIVLFTVAGLLPLDGRRAWGADTPFMGTKADANRAPGEVSSVGETRGATASVLDVAPHQTEPGVGTSNEKHVPSFAETMSALDVSFSRQQSDVEWSGHAEAQVHELFRPLTIKDTSLVSVHCRTTLCRVEFLHATAAESHNFMETLRTGVVTRGWKGPGVGGIVATNEGGRVKSVFYLAKEGTTLPLQTPIVVGAGDGESSAKR